MFRVFNPDTAWGKKLHDMLMGIREGIIEKYVSFSCYHNSCQ